MAFLGISKYASAAFRAVAAAFLTLAIVSTCALPSFAAGGQTGNIAGSVIDGVTKAPVANATVTALSPTGRGITKTDSHGTFNLLGLTVDTYSLTITATGFETLNLNGITVAGDQTVTLDPTSISKTIKTIGRTAARSQSSVYQPSQTTDTVTVSGTRVTEALGKAAATNESALALSIPGVQLTSGGRLTVRGALASDVGYQIDGVNFTEPFLLGNSNSGFLNGLNSLQVVAGSGDASQGNVGSGVVNTIIKRGTTPAFGLLDLEAGAPNFNHQFDFEYGFATPNGRISNYTSFNGQRFVPLSGPFNSNVQNVANLFGTSLAKNDDLINNFVYKFGKDQNQSLQILGEVRDLQTFGNVGGLNAPYYPYNGYAYSRFVNPVTGGGGGVVPGANGLSKNVPNPINPATGLPDPVYFYQNSIYYTPNVPSAGQFAPTGAIESGATPTRLLKFEYTNNINATTFLTARDYTSSSLSTGGGNVITGSTSPNYSTTGGYRTGLGLDITKLLGDKNTLTIGASFENDHPIWDGIEAANGFNLLFAGSPGNGANGGGQSLYDFLTPANTSAPISATNPCPTGVGAATPAGDPNGCYLYSTGQFNGVNGPSVTRIPAFGVAYNQTDFIQTGVYIRDQFSPTRQLKFDVGIRMDSAVYKQGKNPFNPTDLANPDDVTPSFLRDAALKPRVYEPRGSFSYQINNANSFRFGYGRSVDFQGGQTFGTPSTINGLDSRLLNIAPLPGTNIAGKPSTYTCGSGYNPSHLTAGPGSPNDSGSGGGYFQCTSYGQQLYWNYDQIFDAPDVGNTEVPTYNNFDATLQHQFKGGAGLRLTGYFKRGYSVPAFAQILVITDPTTGAILNQVFATSNKGINKTSGVELGFSLPDKAVGLTGYLSATYTNVIQSTPPLISGEDGVPLVSQASLALGKTYRAGYVSPFVINAGAQYKTKSGFRFNPIFNYDRGYPIGVGNTTASGGNTAGGSQINGVFYNIPTSNLSPGIPSLVDYRGAVGAFTSPNYVDPVNPGNAFHPYFAATRGTAETSAAGGLLSRPRLYANASIEYSQHKNTFGVLLTNLFDNVFSEPSVNPFYQPVATGIAGPQSGTQVAGNPNAPSNTTLAPATPTANAYLYGQRNLPAYQTSPFILLPNAAPRAVRFYYQLAL